jgi:predicted nucleic acid-binding protein
MLYFDTSYIVRLYTKDAGWERVRELASTDQLACSIHGQAETVAAFHRKHREGAIQSSELDVLIKEFCRDSDSNGFQWISITPSVVQRVISVYTVLAPSMALRSADAIHLGCAADAGLARIFSNDARLLAAASAFGIEGVNFLQN